MSSSSSDQAARVLSHGGRQPPTIGPGHLRDPQTMSRYADVGIAYVCRQQQKGVALPDILSNFVDGLSENLAAVTSFKQNEPHLTQLSFPDFMTAFRDRFLPSTWKKDLANEIWQEMMTPGAIFIDWIEHLHGRNGLLTSYPEFITDNVFLSNLRSRISKPLQDAIRNVPEIRECNDLNAWTKLVTVQDDELRCKCKELEDLVEATMATRNKRPHLSTTETSSATTTTAPTPDSSNTQPARNDYHYPPRRGNSAPTSASSSNTPFTYKYQSRLETDERAVLAANDGCFTCRDIDIPKEEQGYGKCKGKPPPASGYERRTPEWVFRCRADKAKGIPLFTIAVVTNNAASSSSQTPAAAPIAPAPTAAVQVLATTAWPVAAAVPANASGVLEATNADGTEADANLSVDSEIMSKPPPVPFAVPHLLWHCAVDNRDPGALEPRANITALVDDGAHLVLIRLQLVDRLHLKRCLLPEPIEIGVAVSDSPSPACKLTEWVKLKPHDISAAWSSRTVCAIIAPSLCSDIILGLPFLAANQIVIDHHTRTVIAKQANFDLLHPTLPVPRNTPVPFATIHLQTARVNHVDSRALPFYHLSTDETSFAVLVDPEYEHLCNSDVITALRTNIERLAFLDRLKSLHNEIKEEYKDVFQPLPHAETLPTHTTCKIKLKNTDKVITS